MKHMGAVPQCMNFTTTKTWNFEVLTSEISLYGLSTLRYTENLRRNGQEQRNIAEMLTCLGVTATFTHSFPFHHPRTQDMVKGRPLSDDLRKVILNMAQHFDVASIHHYTGCATRSIERLLTDWRKNSTIVRDLTARRRRGKRQILSGTNIRVHLTICLIFLSLY